MENKQKPVERETRQLIQTYNVLLKSQIMHISQKPKEIIL